MKNWIVYLFGISFLIFSCKSILHVTEVPNTPEEQEINKLISKMTLEEKVGQTCQITLDVLLQTNADGSAKPIAEIDSVKLNEAIQKYKVGSVLNVGSHTLTRKEWTGIHTAIHQDFLKGRSAIPIIYGVDAIHGMNYTVGATLFPQEIGLAATWNPNLAEQFATISAYETRASGIPWNFSPVLDLARQPLWSRNFETLGEDPYLASQMGAAIIKGYQGTTLDQFHVAACLKHFVGYSAAQSGRDRTPAWIPEKYMKELYLPAFKQAVDAGALTVMVNSGVVNGIPGHLNYDLLTKTLKDEWGFQGFAVSDWEDFILIHTVHHTAPTLKTAYINAFNAGVDMSMVPYSPQYKEYCEIMLEGVKSGAIPISRLDDAVRRILRVKTKLGLFNKALVNFDAYPNFASAEFKNKSKETALESITLLKNVNNVLPLTAGQKVLIAGPCSDNMIYLNGAWTHTWQGTDAQYNTEGCKTILQAFQSKLGKDNCLFSKGAELVSEKEFEKTNFIGLEDYKSKLDLVDVVVLCLGELPATEKPGDIHSLNLDAEQRALAQLAYAKNKKVIIVLCEGRPRIIHDIVEGAAAIIQAYLPGDYGADAIVDLMFGTANFSGRLPYTYPKYDGVIEFYDHPYSVDRAKSGNFEAYSPEWDFGFGLSYSKISYGDIILDKSVMNQNESISLSVKIKNESNIPVKEVVQLYLSDLYASMVPTGKSLKKFQKIEIPANGEMIFKFSLTKDDLKFVNEKGDFVAEEGDFKISIGNKTASFKLVK